MQKLKLAVFRIFELYVRFLFCEDQVFLKGNHIFQQCSIPSATWWDLFLSGLAKFCNMQKAAFVYRALAFYWKFLCNDFPQRLFKKRNISLCDATRV